MPKYRALTQMQVGNKSVKKGAEVEYSEQDAKHLLKIKAIEAIKDDAPAPQK